jgi:50S ribosomal subunit-associated GTPase HflX
VVQGRTIDGELDGYGAGLDERPQIVVLNKIDLEPDPELAIDDPRVIAVFRLSCATGEGVDEFRRRLFSLVPEPEVEERGEDELADYLVYKPEAKARPWRLLRVERGYRVVGTPPSEAELERALKAAGARKGATVEVGDEEFELA